MLQFMRLKKRMEDALRSQHPPASPPRELLPNIFIQRALTNPTQNTLTPEVVLSLQKTHGNRVATQLVQRAMARARLAEPDTPDGTLSRQLDDGKGQGEPLPDPVRGVMESNFGADLGDVRIHTGSDAAQMNTTLDAHAFTHGHDIYFGENRYQPGTQHGNFLLAHELAHTQQPGAHQRIACWAPEGHRQVTAKAFQDAELARRYSEEVRKILIERSPDMDFIQDQQHDMNAGIEESTENIKEYKQKAKAFVKTKDDTKARELRTRLDEMWIGNMLHRRDTNYMRMHGEAGEYRMGTGDAAAINRAVTVQFVEHAAEAYNAGETTGAIEILADAIHQSEDRGSHFEGASGKGHDARQKIPMSNRVQAHRGSFQGVPAIPYIKDPHPDNSTINQDGAQRAIGYAQDALYYFANRVKGVVGISQVPMLRHIVAHGFETTSKGKATGLASDFVGGLKTGSHISSLGPVAKTNREGLTGVAKTEQSREALAYYLAGQKKQKESDIYREAKSKFQGFGKGRWRGGKNKGNRVAESQAYYQEKVDPLKREVQGIALAIKAAFYEAFLGRTLDVEPDYTEGTRNDDVFIAAFEQFLLLSMDDSKELPEQIEVAKAYYKARVLPFHETYVLFDRAIKRAYHDQFTGTLF